MTTTTQSTARRVLLAAPRGYCAGVDRAVRTVELALEKFGTPVYVRKHIVHNTHVVKALQKRGAVFVDELDEVPSGAHVVYSAHGVAPQVRDEAAERGLLTVDATCPLVTKVHQEAKRFAAQDFDILLIGHEGHEEVIGTSGEAPRHVRLVGDVREAREIAVRDPKRVAWLSQTTLSVDETQEIVGELRERFPALAGPPSSDICYATQNRQAAVRALAADTDLMLVVGSTSSSNSKRLVEVALAAGAERAFLLDDATALDPAWLDGVEVVGVTSGASVPEILVDDLLELLADHGYSDVEARTSTVEDMEFSLPREVRPQ